MPVLQFSDMSEFFYVNINELIGKNVKKFREEANIGQTELAKAVGVSRKYINELEMGFVNSRINVLCKIAKEVGKNLADIISTAEFHDINKVGEKEVIYVVNKKGIKPYNGSLPPQVTE